jgi:hypothetical protein
MNDLDYDQCMKCTDVIKDRPGALYCLPCIREERRQVGIVEPLFQTGWI